MNAIGREGSTGRSPVAISAAQPTSIVAKNRVSDLSMSLSSLVTMKF
jgi:hypothetical protein